MTDVLYRGVHPIVLPIATAADDLHDYLGAFDGQPDELEHILASLAGGLASALLSLAVACDTAAIRAALVPGTQGQALEGNFVALRQRLLKAEIPGLTPHDPGMDQVRELYGITTPPGPDTDLHDDI